MMDMPHSNQKEKMAIIRHSSLSKARGAGVPTMCWVVYTHFIQALIKWQVRKLSLLLE
jgi:hypothetical protein